MTPTMYEGPKPSGKTAAGFSKMPRRHEEGPRSSPLLVIGGLIVITGLGGYLYSHANPDSRFKAQFDQVIAAAQAPLDTLSQHVQLPSVARGVLAQYQDPRLASQPAASKKPKPSAKKDKSAEKPLPPPEPVYSDPATLFLRNGERVTGEFVRSSPQEVVLRWDYGEASFKRSEILDMLRPKAAKKDTSSLVRQIGGRVTLHLTNGGKVTGKLLYDLPDEVILLVEASEVNFLKKEIHEIVPYQENALP